MLHLVINQNGNVLYEETDATNESVQDHLKKFEDLTLESVTVYAVDGLKLGDLIKDSDNGQKKMVVNLL